MEKGRSQGRPFSVGSSSPRSRIQERPQLAGAAGVLQLPERLGLDLADALAGHRELLADFLEGVVGVHADAEAHAQHAFLARGEARQHPRRGLAQVGLDRRRSEEHTSELQSLMRISYAVFCLQKKTTL